MAAGGAPVVPEYRLDLDVDFAGRRWTGSVGFDLTEPSGPLALDAEELEVTHVFSRGRPVSFSTDRSERVLRLPPLDAGPVMVTFLGRVNETSLSGLYRSRQGKGYVLTTQCEPIGARRIFPCFDRPDRKSRIALRVVTDADLTVIANMIERATREVSGRREWTFFPTPTMATYLFYLGIGRFDVLEDAEGRIRFRVFTPPQRSAAGEYGLGIAPRVLSAFEAYYGIPYPLPKLDLVAVAEASFGAMENWGAIAFQNDRLLRDASSHSYSRRDVLETIAHEVAHMWFGNLVTMSWWTDIWLNESLASFLETKVSAVVDPGLDCRSDFFLRVAGTQAALEGDSLDATHPVRAPVARPEEIAQIFDEISYGKGSTILAMLESYLGEETFRRGVAEYLHRFAYSNARTADLWAALEQAAHEAIAPLVDPWLDRPGLPVISARLTDAGLELSQRRFSYHDGGDAPPWPIPMVIDVGGRRERLRFDTTHRTVPVPSTATIHLNPGAAGFYRVAYDPTLFERLLTDLPTRPATDRWTFLEDLGAFLEARTVDWATYERAVRALGVTPDRLVVEHVAESLRGLALSFPDCPKVVDLARWFFAEQFDRLGPERRISEPDSDGVLRERISTGRVELDAGFARELAASFPEWERTDPDLRPAIAIARARSEGTTGYRELRQAIEADRTEEERSALERALAWTTEPELLRETLERTASGNVNRGNVHYVLGSAAANPAGRPVVWPWLTTHLNEIDRVLRASGLFSRALEAVIPLVGLGREQDVREFFRAHPFPEGERGIAKGLERLAILDGLGPTLRPPPR